MYKTVKCRMCRKVLFNETDCDTLLINAHEEKIGEAPSDNDLLCPSIQELQLIYLSEYSLPEWVKDSVQSENWSKGKLHCKECNVRIGGFDFVSGMKCACANSVLPAVHIIKSKVDLIKS